MLTPATAAIAPGTRIRKLYTPVTPASVAAVERAQGAVELKPGEPVGALTAA